MVWGRKGRITGVISLNEQERMGNNVEGEGLVLDKSMNSDYSVNGNRYMSTDGKSGQMGLWEMWKLHAKILRFLKQEARSSVESEDRERGIG